MLGLNEVEFVPCSAIHITVGDAQRRPAFVYHDKNDEYRNGDMIIWGESIPKSQNELEELIKKIQEGFCEYSCSGIDYMGMIYK